MFIIRLMRFIRGYVDFRATGGFLERFLNLTSREAVRLWEMRSLPGEVTGRVFAGDYRLLAAFAKQCGVRLRAGERHGLPFAAKKHRKRLGAAIGAAAFILLLLFLQSFVWTVDVSGNERIGTEQIKHVLGELGLRPGAFLPFLDLKEIENKAILELDGVAWFTINNFGSRIAVEMAEAIEPPVLIDDDEPVDIIAAKTGVIRESEIYSGKALKEPGNVVVKGDLLVSGRIDDDSEQIRYVHARAKILAETDVEEVFEVLREETVRTATGKTYERNYLVLFGWKLPLFLSLPLEGSYDVSVTETPVFFLGVQLPCSVQTNRYSEVTERTVSYDREKGEQRLREIYEDYKRTQLSETTVLNEEAVFSEEEDRFLLKVNLVCYENIALEQKIIR